jgi:uncharacterized membrane protein YbhN (UPF0104 family)
MKLKEMSATSKIRWVGTILSLGLLIYLIYHNWGELVLAVQKITVSSLLLALLIMLISRLAVGSRWYMLLRVTDFDVTWWKTLRITFAGLFASNFLPTTIGGDVIRLAGAVQFRMDGAVSAASLIVDRLVGMLGMALALPLGIPQLWTWLSTRNSPGAEISSNLAILATFSKWWLRGKSVLKRIWHSLTLWRGQPRSLLFALFFTGIHQLCLYLSITLFLRDLGESLPFWQIPGIWSYIYFVTLLPISINGYGVQELALTFFFSQVAGVSESSALAVAVLIRTIQMLASLPGAAFLPAIMAGEHRQGPTDG